MDEVITINSYTMIALHLRDSTMHLITSSQQIGFGIPICFGGSSFHSFSPSFEKLLLLISATSIGQVLFI